MQIRDLTIDDVVQLDRIRAASVPWHTAGVETQRGWIRNMPEAAKFLRLCAVLDGKVVAFASGGFELTATRPGMATGSVQTHPDFRGRGFATALYERVEAHLRAIGAKEVQANAVDEPAVLDWATRRGFEFGATDRVLVVDPRTVAEVALPAGVTVAAAAETGPEPVYQVDNTAAQDEPGDVGFAGMPYEDWVRRYWGIIDRDASMLAYVDGAPAAITMLDVNRETGRAQSNGSSTLREYRGRGLMKVLKAVSLRRAAGLGVTAAFTSNDEENAPMLAINEHLGYRFFAASRSVVKKL